MLIQIGIGIHYRTILIISSKIVSYDAVVVFNLNKPGNISKAIRGEKVGTIIGGAWNSTTERA